MNTIQKAPVGLNFKAKHSIKNFYKERSTKISSKDKLKNHKMLKKKRIFYLQVLKNVAVKPGPLHIYSVYELLQSGACPWVSLSAVADPYG